MENKHSAKVWNLQEKRPKVLLIGSGLVRNQGVNWEQIICKAANDPARIAEYKKSSEMACKEKTKYTCNDCRFAAPYTLLALATSPANDQERRKRYTEILGDRKYFQYGSNPTLYEFLNLPFDAVLTTNYTYEIENELCPSFINLKTKSQQRKSISIYKGNGRDIYMTQRYYKFEEELPEIWHIHGEVCRPTSIALTHDEYIRQISAVIDYTRRQKNRYENGYKSGLFEFKSWIDYMLMADVHIVGFSIDYSEVDQWWVLGRRMREKAKVGEIVFYSPPKIDTGAKKQLLLEDLHVKVESCGFAAEETKNDCDYERFYRAVLKKIKETFSQNIALS